MAAAEAEAGEAEDEEDAEADTESEQEATALLSRLQMVNVWNIIRRSNSRPKYTPK